MADEVLVENSERFNYVVQRAKFIISPMDLPKSKHKNQFWIMTWHGSPIKKIYLSRDKNNSNFIEYVSKFKNVDVFCNQSEVHEKILLEAFKISKSQILNCGLPRNDILFQNNQELKIKLKQKMCIPEHKKIILYCPTWRRYDKKANLPFNLDNMREKLSDNYIIILRSHVGKHSWVDSDNNPINIFDNKFCFDGSCVQKVTDLYLISDLMISDYSSSIFDFAITEKPQILYIYDYENYKNEFGLYYDYNTFAPFPKVKTEEELINIIKNYNNNDINYTQFKQDYLFFEKGTASKQIADLIFKIARN